MGLALGNLLGAASSIMQGFSGEAPVKKFIDTVDSVGIQITSRYEAIFSAIPQSTFFIQSISVPGMKQNKTSIYFDGKLVELPSVNEYNHDFNVTVINDASGFIYAAFSNLVLGDTGNAITNNGYTMTITAIGDDNFKGSTIKMNGVRIWSLGSLQYQHEGGSVQTFELGCSAIDFSYAPGAVGLVSGVTGALGSLVS